MGDWVLPHRDASTQSERSSILLTSAMTRLEANLFEDIAPLFANPLTTRFVRIEDIIIIQCVSFSFLVHVDFFLFFYTFCLLFFSSLHQSSNSRAHATFWTHSMASGDVVVFKDVHVAFDWNILRERRCEVVVGSIDAK